MLSIAVLDKTSYFFSAMQNEIKHHDKFCSIEYFDDFKALINSSKKNTPDIIILDYLCQDLSGDRIIYSLRLNCPEAFLVAFSFASHKFVLERLFAVGLNLHISRSASTSEILSKIMEKLNAKKFDLDITYSKAFLTSKEKKIISYLAQGYSSKQIADLCNNSISTINNQKNKILRKLNCKNSSELMVQLISLGYIKL